MTDTYSAHPYAYTGNVDILKNLYGRLNNLVTATESVRAYCGFYGTAKGAVTTEPSVYLERYSEWYRIRELLGQVLCPDLEEQASKVLEIADHINDILSCGETVSIDTNGRAERTAALHAIQHAFETYKVNAVMANAWKWASDGHNAAQVGRDGLEAIFDRLGKLEGSIISPRLAPIWTVLPLDQQFVDDVHAFELVKVCREATEKVKRFEDDLSSLVQYNVQRGERCITFTRKTSGEQRPVAHADYLKLCRNVQQWIKCSGELSQEIKAGLGKALKHFDKHDVQRRIASIHNLIGAQVLYNHLGTLYDVAMLHTVNLDIELHKFAASGTKGYEQWRKQMEKQS